MEKYEKEIYQTIKGKQRRKERMRRSGHRTAWLGFSLFGVVGWSVVVPTLLGLVVGLYIDTHHPGRYAFTLMGLLIGAMVGSWLAWHWMDDEQRFITKERDDDA